MPHTRALPWLAAAMIASIAAMITGITSGLPALSWIAALLFAAALVATAYDVNADLTAQAGPGAPSVAVVAAVRNARMLAMGYIWGSLALLCIYRLTGLRWQHGLQYGAGMALIAWLILLYVHLLSQPESRLGRPSALAQAMWMSIAHGAGAVAGLGFLIGSGKLFSSKADWAANQIFLAGGLAIAGLSVISVMTHLRLKHAHPPSEAAHAKAGSPSG